MYDEAVTSRREAGARGDSASAGSPDAEPWHSLALEEVASTLDTSLTAGLSPEEAARRLAEFGPNELEAEQGASPWRLLLDQFKNVLIVILLVAVGAVGRARARDRGRRHRGDRALRGPARASCRSTAPNARSRRCARWRRRRPPCCATASRETCRRASSSRVTSSCSSAGDRAPADGRVSEVVNLQVEEAALTGESLPVEKQTERARRTTTCRSATARNMVYAGTTVTYGRGRAVVVATGMQHRVRRDRAAAPDGRAEQDARSSRTSTGSGWPSPASAIVVVLVVVGLGLLRGQPFLEMLLFGIAAGRRRRSRGAAGRGHDLAHARRAADGQAQRAHPSPAGDRDARQRLRHLLRQDRHAHQGRDDGAQGLRRRRDARRLRRGLRAGGRVPARRLAGRAVRRRSSRRCARRSSPPTRRSCATRTTGQWRSARRPDRGRARRGGRQGRARQARPRRRASRAWTRSPSPRRPSA